jgi:hypothetical protein
VVGFLVDTCEVSVVDVEILDADFECITGLLLEGDVSPDTVVEVLSDLLCRSGALGHRTEAPF